jgi:hypothetical protein
MRSNLIRKTKLRPNLMFRRIAENLAAQLVSLTLSIGDRLLLVGVLVRAWGTTVYADWAQLMATAALISLGEVGLNIYFGNAWQAAFARDDSDAFARVLAVAVCIYGLLVVGLLALVAGGLAVADPAHTIGLRGLDAATSRIVLGFLGAAAVLKVGRGLLSQLYRGKGEFARGILLESLASAVLLCATITSGLLGAGVTTVAACYLAAEIGGGWFMTGADIRRRFPELRFRPSWPTGREICGLVSQVKWLAILQGTPIIWLNLPVLLLAGVSASSNAIVAFVLMRTMVNFARMLVAMLSLATGVELASAAHSGNAQAVKAYLVAAGMMGSVAAAVLCSGLYTFLKPLLVLWSGHVDLEIPSVVAWLSAGLLGAAPGMPLAAFAMLGGAARAVGLTNISQLALGLTFGWAGGQLLGLPGLAAGLAIGEIVAQVFVLWLAVGPIHGLARSRHVFTCIWRAALAVAWGLATGAVVTRAIGSGTVAHLAVAVFIWGLLGGAPALLLGFDRATSARLLAIMRGNGWPAPEG